MKSKGNFKLSKTSKMMMATIVDPQKRADFRKAMVSAEVAASIVPKSKKEKFVTGTSTLDN